ncbi:Chromoplast-specific carotenoid-associated protein C1, chromoplastic [Gracilariopsis chorda]|uniref:Chromoplast-specific carotenoid-associated protein C1, chromoplastic n=1 Tax=Gracilariopsis chorda TaxID=448386 RepID=A0A2V3IV97_9FLOR|nr:Chromoplast-specific carotenoid-associated protein C1, chromoplastic [Gracilariopsis chorda]|eukprot:PXF46052.1 Chromoplast-specific carotenoid-associated protein C1, chromoplastic [Gracilariopsis chorda]
MDVLAFTTTSSFLRLTPGTQQCSFTCTKRAATPNVARRARPLNIRMELEGEEAEDEAPSDVAVPVGDAVKTMIPGMDEAKRTALVAKLLQYAAITDRGQSATDAQVSAVDDIVMSLEEVNPNPQPVEIDLIDGEWNLVYTAAKLFQTNPFLMAAATPLLQVGQVRQRISVDEGKLSTEVEVIAFPVTSWTVKTTGRITPVGAERLEVTVETTNITGGKIADRIDLGGISFDVPVEQIYSRIRNASPETYVDTYYLDETLRISRSKEGKLYIYTRLD